jgi:hypothetical protein
MKRLIDLKQTYVIGVDHIELLESGNVGGILGHHFELVY